MSATWSFKFGAVASPTTITSLVQGFRVSQSVRPGSFGIGSATLTVDNDDGAFTPSTIGGTGTYASTDWLAQGVWIDCTVNGTTVPVFHGIVTDLEVSDNGHNSTVQITASPSWVIGGRTGAPAWAESGNTASFQSIWEAVWTGENAGDAAFWNTEFPLLGRTNQEKLFTFAGGATDDTPFLDVYYQQDKARTALDTVNNYVTAAGPFVAWPTTIGYDTTWVQHHATVLGPAMSRDIDITTFAGTGAASGEVAVQAAQSAYLTDQVVNRCEVTGWYFDTYSITTRSAEDTASIAAYGPRALRITDSWALTSGGGLADPYVVDNCQRVADWWVNRYADAVYAWSAVTTSEAAVDLDDANTATAWRRLLDITTGLWLTVRLDLDPTAGTSTDSLAVISGRLITGTPGNVRVRFNLVPYSPNSSLLLDDTDRGILDTDRLG